jgi:hypothetical protein
VVSEDGEQIVPQASFSGYAVVEMMGHRKEIGYVTTQAFGPAVLFRVDTPELPEREYVMDEPGYANAEGRGRCWCPVGTKVKRAASPARSCLVAPGSLYALNPCSEEFALTALERSVVRPLIVLEMPAQPALQPAPDDEGELIDAEYDEVDNYP